jgi:hypothetical protein
MKLSRILLCLVLGVFMTLPALAQGNPTARLNGNVVSADGAALPGATVTFESPNLLGTRVVVTDGNGNYSSPPLPPGEYEVTYQLEGFGTQTRRIRLSAAQNIEQDITLDLAEVSEEIIVSGEAVEVISEGTTSAQTITREELESLPVARSLQGAVTLSAGVFETGPGGNIVINGAQSWENLFLLNGVVLNENLRGQPFDLFIEDAIQETTTATSGVSAEFGRFTGGVVNAITKSGGNQFSGSFRTSFDNDDWEAESPGFPDGTGRTNEVNNTFEATFGGPVLRDRLWFFLAGRDRETELTQTTQVLNIPYVTPRTQERYEGKLTLGITQSHQLQASILDIEDIQGNNAHGGLTEFAVVIDDGTLANRELPQRLTTANYTGILTSNFFIEAQASEREFSFVASGGLDRDLITGTPIWDFQENVIYNESLFCGSCRDEDRNNENQLAKASYFLSTDSAGSHDLLLGYDTFEDIRAADNHQAPTDVMVWNANGSVIQGNQIFPIYAPNGGTFIDYLPILNPTQGTSFVTNSIFLNDRWRLNDNWSFNLGVRYDENDFKNSLGQGVIQSDEISPRLGATYRPGLDSPWQFNASYGKYVGQVPNTVGNSSSPAGSAAQFEYVYLGPPVNTPGQPLVDPVAANQILFDWFLGVCPNFQADPFSCPQELVSVISIPGATEVIEGDLASSSADEWTLGFTRQLGNRGSVRLDVVSREWENFFSIQRDLVTGRGSDENGNTFDRGVVINDNDVLSREYMGANLLFNYRFFNNRLNLGGNYTLSETEGNFTGETSGSGPVTSDFFEYPEFTQQSWAVPVGRLGSDQTHRARVWGIYDLFRTENHYLNVSLLQTFLSGTPYGANADINSRQFVDPAIVGSYISPPGDVDYWFTDRDAFETDDLTRTDLSLNYSLSFNRFEIFFQPEILNVFDEDAVVDVNVTSIATAFNGGRCDNGAPDATGVNRCLPFNPFTTTPVEGVNYQLGANFGQPVNDDDYQQARTYRFSVGFRF